MSAPELILPPTRSLGTAVASFLATAIVLLLMFALLFDPAVTTNERIAVGLLGALFALTLGAVGVALLRGHGALMLDLANRRLGLGVTRDGDTWWLGLGDIRGLAVLPQASPGRDTVERWLLVLGLVGRPEVVLAESDDRNAILGIQERLAARLSITQLPEDRSADSAPTFVATHERFAVSRGAALQTLLATFGASLIAVGVISFLEVQREPVVGFIFAPILVVMGVALLAVPIVKRLAHETLSFDGLRWTHAFAFGKWRWGERSVRGTPRFRLRLLGMRGGMLELVGEDGVLIMAAGATSNSSLDLEAIAALPRRFVDGAKAG